MSISGTAGMNISARIAAAQNSNINNLQTIKLNASDPWQNAPSIGSIQSVHGLDVLRGFGSESLHHTVKKYEVYESPHDVLALSAAWKRLRDNKKYITSKLLSGELFKELNEDDIVKAKEIKDYYSKKIMMWNLKNIRMTSFRNDLNDFIHNCDGKVVRENMLPLVASLPTLYEYDCEIDEVRSQVTVNLSPNFALSQAKVSRLEPIKCIHKKQKRVNIHEYWFKDLDTNGALVVKLEPKNPLRHMWDHFFNTKKVMLVNGFVSAVKKDDFSVLLLRENWELVL